MPEQENRIIFDLGEIDVFYEVTPHYHEYSRTFIIFQVPQGDCMDYWGVEKRWFENEQGEFRIPGRFNFPRYRLYYGHTMDECRKLCRAQVEINYLTDHGMNPINAAMTVLSRINREEDE